jgi:exodeoxyribonuclease III
VTRPKRFLTLNVGAAIVPRMVRIWDWIARQEADFIVLTETSRGPGTSWLVEQSRVSGFNVVQNDCSCNGRGVTIFCTASLGMEETGDRYCLGDHCRLVIRKLPGDPPVHLVAMYAHSRRRRDDVVSRKMRLLEEAERVLGVLQDQDCIFGGDFNVASPRTIRQHTGFLPFEARFLGMVEEMGFQDASAGCAEDDRYSWVGRTGKRYQYDFWYVSKSLKDQVERCGYIHETRSPLAISDHSAVVLDLLQIRQL